MAICKGCGQQIDWVKTTGGRSMPVDPEYIEIDPAGIPHDTIVTDAGEVMKGFRITEEGSLFQTENKIRGRMPHWATCLKSGSFRR